MFEHLAHQEVIDLAGRIVGRAAQVNLPGIFRRFPRFGGRILSSGGIRGLCRFHNFFEHAFIGTADRAFVRRLFSCVDIPAYQASPFFHAIFLLKKIELPNAIFLSVVHWIGLETFDITINNYYWNAGVMECWNIGFRVSNYPVKKKG
jgi:hypothetical protein